MDIDLSKLNELSADDLKRIGQAPAAVKAILLVILLVAVCSGGLYLLVKPKIESLKTLEKKETALRQNFEQTQKKAAKLEAYEQQMEEMRITFGSMLKSLPDKTEVESILVEISRAASTNNLEILKFTPQGEKTKDFYAEYPITMALKGSYPELTGFLTAVSGLERIVTLHDMNLTPIDSDEENGELSIDLNAKTYRYLSDGK